MPPDGNSPTGRYGLASLEEAVGRVDLLEQVRGDGGLDLSAMLVRPEGAEGLRLSHLGDPDVAWHAAPGIG